MGERRHHANGFAGGEVKDLFRTVAGSSFGVDLVDNKDREQFIQQAVAMMARFSNENVMILIEGDTGLKMLQTHPSFTWTFGLLAVAEKMADERYRTMMNLEANQKAEADANKEINAEIKATTGKVN